MNIDQPKLSERKSQGSGLLVIPTCLRMGQVRNADDLIGTNQFQKNQPFDSPRSEARGVLRVDTERRS